jgi:hypothetical protein
MKTEQIAVDELIPYENNPRKHSRAQIEQICDSIEEFGFVAPIIIDEANIVIAGHGRLQAAQKIGLSRIPAVRVAHLSDSQKRALRVADNRLTERAEWDLEGLAEEIKALESEEYDLDILGFDADWLERINLASLGITSAGAIGAISRWHIGQTPRSPNTWPALFRKPGTTGAADQRSAASRAAQILGEKTTTCPGSISGAGLDSIKRYAPGWGSKS